MLAPQDYNNVILSEADRFACDSVCESKDPCQAAMTERPQGVLPQIFIAVAIQSRELLCTVRHSQQHGGISTRAYALAQYDRRAKLGFLLEDLFRQIALGGIGNDGGHALARSQLGCHLHR